MVGRRAWVYLRPGTGSGAWPRTAPRTQKLPGAAPRVRPRAEGAAALLSLEPVPLRLGLGWVLRRAADVLSGGERCRADGRGVTLGGGSGVTSKSTRRKRRRRKRRRSPEVSPARRGECHSRGGGGGRDATSSVSGRARRTRRSEAPAT